MRWLDFDGLFGESSNASLRESGKRDAAKEYKKGGYTGDGDPDTPVPNVTLHKGEYVLPASAVKRIGLDKVRQLASDIRLKRSMKPIGHYASAVSRRF